jgi:L-ascorbate metabolism protein UlaG (beta-lactamase superfamily)
MNLAFCPSSAKMAATMSVRITATGNAGFHVSAPGARVLVDALWDPVPRFLGGQGPGAPGGLPADLILVTHVHWDHFSPGRVAEAAARTGAAVIGPADVVRRLRGAVRDESLIALEPLEPASAGAAHSATVQLPGAAVTAFRTRHGRGHNSYLVRTGDFRFFHDGDNEDTRLLDAGALAPVDALFLCPWQGSGWAEFVEGLAPARWFLIHLTGEELQEHRGGRFLPGLCDRVPMPERIVALGPGEACTLEDRPA